MIQHNLDTLNAQRTMISFFARAPYCEAAADIWKVAEAYKVDDYM